MHEIEASLADVRTALLAGRPVLDAAPSAWRDAVSGDELALLALAGHATDVLTQHSPVTHTARPLLPTLSIPLIPEALRARFRRLLATPTNTLSIERPLIAFVAARGYAAHPADWMPNAKDEWAPDQYAPWLDWVRAETSAPARDADISVATYDDWSWSERRKALEDLRARDPTKALAVIAAKAGSEPAERRLRLVELLQIKLSDSDGEYLESLAKDRSERVQAVARAFLARLGRGGDTSALAAELAEMVEFNRTGLIKRRGQLVLKPLKTNAQILRRRELFGLVSVGSLAQALQASEIQLAESAPLGAINEVMDFVACVANTGGEEAVRTLANALLDDGESTALLASPLIGRLSHEERRALMPRLLKRDVSLLEVTVSLADGSLGATPLSMLTASPAYAALKANIEIFVRPEDAGRSTALRALETILPRAGLLLDAEGARALLAQAAGWGLSPADPRLDMLHFNAALTENAT